MSKVNFEDLDKAYFNDKNQKYTYGYRGCFYEVENDCVPDGEWAAAGYWNGGIVKDGVRIGKDTKGFYFVEEFKKLTEAQKVKYVYNSVRNPWE